MSPRVAAEVLDIKILIARSFDDLFVVHTRAWPNRVDPASLIVFIPRAAVMLPYGVLDPFLDDRQEAQRIGRDVNSPAHDR